MLNLGGCFSLNNDILFGYLRDHFLGDRNIFGVLNRSLVERPP